MWFILALINCIIAGIDFFQGRAVIGLIATVIAVGCFVKVFSYE